MAKLGLGKGEWGWKGWVIHCFPCSMIIIPHYREKHCFPAQVNSRLVSQDQTWRLTQAMHFIQSILLKNQLQGWKLHHEVTLSTFYITENGTASILFLFVRLKSKSALSVWSWNDSPLSECLQQIKDLCRKHLLDKTICTWLQFHCVFSTEDHWAVQNNYLTLNESGKG